MNEQSEQQTPDWNKRHTDPLVKWKWESATIVQRADPSKGIHQGLIIYPDGTRQTFRR